MERDDVPRKLEAVPRPLPAQTGPTGAGLLRSVSLYSGGRSGRRKAAVGAVQGPVRRYALLLHVAAWRCGAFKGPPALRACAARWAQPARAPATMQAGQRHPRLPSGRALLAGQHAAVNTLLVFLLPILNRTTRTCTNRHVHPTPPAARQAE